MLETSLDLKAELDFALKLADAADAIAMQRFRSRELRVTTKPDLTPVTDADSDIESAMREAIARRRSEDAVLGEEFGGSLDTNAEWRWVIDPIDGTKSFARGLETWAVLIGLQHRGQTVVAVASAPATRARYHAVAGGGSFRNWQRIHVSEISDISQAVLVHTSVSGFVRIERDAVLREMAGRCWESAGLGNSLSHLAVARGSAEIGWTSRAQPWDFAALALIVQEAGGEFLDDSRASALGGTGISANAHLFPTAMQLTQEVMAS